MDRSARGFGAREVRWLIAAVIAVLLFIFALMNRQRVEIDYIFFSRESRLVWVIIVSGILGAIADRLLLLRRRRL